MTAHLIYPDTRQPIPAAFAADLWFEDRWAESGHPAFALNVEAITANKPEPTHPAVRAHYGLWGRLRDYHTADGLSAHQKNITDLPLYTGKLALAYFRITRERREAQAVLDAA